MKPLVIGLTGTYCAGKNHVAKLLEARNIPALDVDKLGHQAIEMEKAAILARFGKDILGNDGAIDRKRLGNKVFGDPEALSELENLVHPGANRLTEQWIARQTGRACAVNAALLHKSRAFSSLDFIIVVKAPLLTRLLRAKKRDSLSWAQLFKRFRSQRDFGTQYLRKNADMYTIYNGGALGLRLFGQPLEHQIDRILALRGIAIE
ncbi:MAG: dephospho-CoA kinase [Spirochaetaceae bacterium]|nr:dephospho-CoA kinase [Spirochaetaceae bacterium]